ncbi:MAG TPA: type IV pilus assembly protein PilM [Armatimonadota bacterium]|nr:type IV pilus assembly protein PilM [Armatimonadota bacterium]
MARTSGPFVGLDIGSAFIKVVEITPRGGHPELTAAGIMPTPPDALVHGEILDPPALGAMLRHLLEISGIKSRRVVSSLAGANNVTVRIIPVPKMPEKELAETMRYEIERFVPFAHGQPIEKAYQILPIPADNDANMQVILTVAIQSVVISHIQALMSAGLEPVAVEVEPLAVARSITGFGEAARPLNDTVGIVNLGASSTELSVVTDGVLIFPRTISIGGDAFTKAIAENLGMRVDAAERLKRQYAAIDPDRIVAAQAGQAGDDFGFGAMMDFTSEPSGPAAPPAFDFNGPSVAAAPGMNPMKYSGAPGGGPAGFAAPASEDEPVAASVFDLGDAGPEEGDLFSTQAPKPASRPPATPGPFDAGGAFDLGGAAAPAAGGFDTAGFDIGGGTAPAAGGGGAMSPEEEEAYTARQVQDIILPVLGELVTELRRSLEYYRSHNQSLPLSKLILCGGSARMPNLDKFLENELGISVQIANPLASATVNMPGAPQSWLDDISPLLAVSMGLGEREVIETPRDYVPRTLAAVPAAA